jgi:hypothetical protein
LSKRLPRSILEQQASRTVIVKDKRASVAQFRGTPTRESGEGEPKESAAPLSEGPSAGSQSSPTPVLDEEAFIGKVIQDLKPLLPGDQFWNGEIQYRVVVPVSNPEYGAGMMIQPVALSRRANKMLRQQRKKSEK